MTEATRLIGMSSTSLHYWIDGTRQIRKRSLKKLEKGIELIDKGEIKEVEPFKQKKTGYKKLPDDLKTSTRIMYEYIYLIENKYGSLVGCPSNAPELVVLRSELGVVSEGVLDE